MGTFELKNKSGETINKISASSIENAVVIFSKIKRLSIDSLLGIFTVV